MGEEADSGTATRDERWGMCSARACPLPGTVGRGGQWWCFCHVEADAGTADAVTRIVRSHRAVYTATLDVRAHVGADDWLCVYRSVQQRLLDAGQADLLPCALDASPYRPGRPIVRQWLARLERFLLDAVRDGLRRASVQVAPGNRTPPRAPTPSSLECIARMRATLAPLAKREASVQWAFDLLDRISTRPANTPRPDALRIALDAVASPAGRAYVASATEEQRARWRVALEAIDSGAVGLMLSREPGEDDEQPQAASV